MRISFTQIPVQIKLLEKGFPPMKGSLGACAYDLRASREGIIYPSQRGTIDTGFCLSLPQGYYCKIECRSSLAKEYGLIALGTVCDSDYRGEYKVMLFNSGDKPFSYIHGDRIAQLILLKHYETDFEIVNELGNTVRGERGFGSTGK